MEAKFVIREQGVGPGVGTGSEILRSSREGGKLEGRKKREHGISVVGTQLARSGMALLRLRQPCGASCPSYLPWAGS